MDYDGFYQGLDPNYRPLGLFFLLSWFIGLMGFILLASSEYLCQNITKISSKLGMSESVAGVVLLSLANGAPDIFSALAAQERNSQELALGELFGSTVFVSCLVTGIIGLITRVKINKIIFLRDCGFLLGALIMVFFSLQYEITIITGILMLFYFFVYIFVVFTGVDEQVVHDHQVPNSCFFQLIWAVFAPMNFILWISVPTKKQKSSIIQVLLGSIVTTLIFYSKSKLFCILPFIFCVSYIFKPKKLLLSFYGLIFAIAWIYIIAGEVVEVLQVLSKALQISETMMGMIFQALGFSISDLISNVTMARKGHVQMAVTASFASPMQNLLLGIGIPAFFQNHKFQKQQKTNLGLILTIVLLMSFSPVMNLLSVRSSIFMILMGLILLLN